MSLLGRIVMMFLTRFLTQQEYRHDSLVTVQVAKNAALLKAGSVHRILVCKGDHRVQG